MLVKDTNMSVDLNKSLAEQFKTINIEDPEFVQKCAQLVEDINQDSFTFLQVIEHLKCLLIDTTPSNRELGMLILTQVLELIPHDKIIPTQLNYICDFYADRLKDHHQVIPATLKGILALLKFENLPEGSTKNMLNSLFHNVACQQQQQQDRLHIFKILQIALENRFGELQDMGFDFVYGVISAVDGERDPRNLLFLFNWLPNFLHQFTLGHLSEEMFEILACYFPVDFRAPPQDPNSISRETLASALSQCLCGTSDFAEYCLPLALEKLSSSLSIAKFDSLDILAKGCGVFPLPFYTQHATDIWSQIQREVLNNNDDELVKIALQTLVIVMNKLSNNTDNIYKPILSDIVDTLKGNLVPNMKLFASSCKILQHLTKSSKTAANFVIDQVVPLMINTFNITLTPSHQILILENLVCFLVMYTNAFENNEIMGNSHLALVPCLCLKASTHNNDELRATGLRCLSQISKSLPYDVRKCVYENLCLSLISEETQLIRCSLLEVFKQLAEIYNNEVQTHILDNIMVKGNGHLYWYLQSLTAIVALEDFTDYTLSIFVKYSQADLETAIISIDCLRQLLEKCTDNRINNYLGVKSEIISKLTHLVLNCINVIDISNEKHQQLLCNISTICKLILGSQNTEVQNCIPAKFNEIVSIYRNCHKVSLIVIIDGLISCLRRDVMLNLDIVTDLFEVALNTDIQFVCPIVIQLLANIINKNEESEKLEHDLNSFTVALDNLDSIKIDRVINILAWITKALLMRGHKMGEVWTKKLLTLLESHEEAAKGFEIIMKEKCVSLNEQSFCNIRILYRQKFFMEISTFLTENYKDENRNYLLAIGYILKEAPTQVFIMQFTKIIKIVLLCLEKCEDGDVLSVVLDTLCGLIENTEPCTEEYIQELLPRFVTLSTFKSSMNVRIKALKCIEHFATGYPLYKLLPLKQGIVQSLTVCLDDKKRLVRKIAVEARLSWIMLDAPT